LLKYNHTENRQARVKAVTKWC